MSLSKLSARGHYQYLTLKAVNLLTGNKDLHTLKEELLILVWSFYRLVSHFYKGKEKDKRILNMIWLGESRCWNMLWNKKGISVYYYYYLLGYLLHVYHCCHSSLHTLISLTNLFSYFLAEQNITDLNMVQKCHQKRCQRKRRMWTRKLIGIATPITQNQL